MFGMSFGLLSNANAPEAWNGSPAPGFAGAKPFFTKDLQLGNDSISDSPQDGDQDRSSV
jgi:hypothetical protein